jgi:hypothetical protein
MSLSRFFKPTVKSAAGVIQPVQPNSETTVSTQPVPSAISSDEFDDDVPPQVSFLNLYIKPQVGLISYETHIIKQC